MSNQSQDLQRQEKLQAFDRLLTIMDELRENCPWDRKQTLKSLRHLTIEETYELSDAILENDLVEIKNELGDIILHMIFYAKIASEQEAFHIGDVLNSVADKLINRHPHIYGDIKVQDEEEVKQNWEKIKLKENGNRSVLGGVPKSLPALVKAMRIQEKARGVGFDWEQKDQVWDKVIEEINEYLELSKAYDVVNKPEMDNDKFNVMIDEAISQNRVQSRDQYSDNGASISLIYLCEPPSPALAGGALRRCLTYTQRLRGSGFYEMVFT